ncbi:LysR family transcriptional regulator [Lentzea sp. NPDC051213]|uniref:LysR family transcriptional regulator n=1 Tax=Lentzea sp. NPDC051213 TaxID=3364126 RepID=UPI003799E82D
MNLLIPLHALLLERNVTKAAERFQVSQPTMSATLARLRRHFDDPLLVREGRTMVLTPLAESMLGPLRSALFSAREVLTTGQTFDPGTDQRTFTIVASDYAATILLRPALRGLATEAPGMKVIIEPLRADLVDMVRSRQCDLLIWPLQLQTDELMTYPHQLLFEDEFIVVADQDNTAVPEPLTGEALATTPGVHVFGAGGRRVVSEVKLNEQLLRQPTMIAVNSFTLALQMVAGTDLITLTQRRLFENLGPALGLREVTQTTEVPKLSLAMFWHPHFIYLPAHQWLRQRLAEVAAEL